MAYLCFACEGKKKQTTLTMDVTSGEFFSSVFQIRGINAGETGHTTSSQNVVLKGGGETTKMCREK